MSHMPSQPTIARAIRRAMQRSGMSQAQLARAIGTSAPAIAEMLAVRRPITTDMLARIAQALSGNDVPDLLRRQALQFISDS